MAGFVALCRYGNVKGVRTSVERGADVNSVDSDGYSGLMRAVRHNHNPVATFLLKQPATDVSRKNSWGRTALHYSVVGNNPAGLSMLLAHPNADPNVRNIMGFTPLYLSRWVNGRNGQT